MSGLIIELTPLWGEFELGGEFDSDSPRQSKLRGGATSHKTALCSNEHHGCQHINTGGEDKLLALVSKKANSDEST